MVLLPWLRHQILAIAFSSSALPTGFSPYRAGVFGASVLILFYPRISECILPQQGLVHLKPHPNWAGLHDGSPLL